MSRASPNAADLVNIDFQPDVRHALDVIEGSYGHIASVDQKGKTLLKFGSNDNLGTTEATVWEQGGIEVLPTTNSIDTVSSSSGSDTGTVVIEGHTIAANGDLIFSVQSATLSGQTKVPLGTPLARATRIYNSGSDDFVGSAYVYEDDTVSGGVPQTAAKIHLRTAGGSNQSLKCATAVSANDYWLITQMYASVKKKQAAFVDFNIQVREQGGVFRTRIPAAVSSTGGAAVQFAFKPLLVVRPNSDIRLNAVSSTSGTAVEGWMNGYLCKIVGTV